MKFKYKSFSSYIASSALKGATVGATLGTLGAGGLNLPSNLKVPKSGPAFFKKGIEKYNDLANTETRTKISGSGKDRKEEQETTYKTSALQNMAFVGTSTIIGAALGALVGAVKDINKKISQSDADNRLMKGVISDLSNAGYVEDLDYTRDPKRANIMKCTVCIVVTKNGADFNMLVNTIKNPKLQRLTDRILKGLSGKYQIRSNNASNKYNDINISTISNANQNRRTIVEIATGFLKEGYPVYLVEVG